MTNQPERKGEKGDIIVAYRSNTPSVSPTLPGPVNAPLWSIEMKPNSQGMRRFRSVSCAAQLHSFMLSIGRLNLEFLSLVFVSMCGRCDWPCPPAYDCSLATNLEGRDAVFRRPDTTARTAVNVKNAYWTMLQKRTDMVTSRK